MSAIATLLELSTNTAPNEWVSEYQESILVRNAKGMNNGASLFGLMSRLKNEPAETTEYRWFERDPVTREVFSVGAGTTVTATGLDFSLTQAGSENVSGLLQPGTVLLAVTGGATPTNEGEMIRIDSQQAGPTYSVTRGFAGTTADTLTDDTKWVIVTLGKGEGASPVSSVYENPSTLVNYIQTFNSAVAISNAFKGSKLRTDIQGPLRERRVQALERIARDIELAYLLGESFAPNDPNPGGQYFTGGIKEAVDSIGASPAQFLDDTSGTVAGEVTLNAVQTWTESFMTVGSENKLLMAGPGVYAMFSNYAASATNGFRITGQENIFGMNIISVLTPFGILDMALHPLLKEITALNDWGFVVDLSLISQKVMEPLFLEPNIQLPGDDSYKEQFRAKSGLKLKFAEAFAYVKGVNTIV